LLVAAHCSGERDIVAVLKASPDDTDKRGTDSSTSGGTGGGTGGGTAGSSSTSGNPNGTQPNGTQGDSNAEGECSVAATSLYALTGDGHLHQLKRASYPQWLDLGLPKCFGPKVTAAALDRQGRLWVSDAAKGLVGISPATGQCHTWSPTFAKGVISQMAFVFDVGTLSEQLIALEGNTLIAATYKGSVTVLGEAFPTGNLVSFAPGPSGYLQVLRSDGSPGAPITLAAVVPPSGGAKDASSWAEKELWTGKAFKGAEALVGGAPWGADFLLVASNQLAKVKRDDPTVTSEPSALGGILPGTVAASTCEETSK
jgi:hypothetical protein